MQKSLIAIAAFAAATEQASAFRARTQQHPFTNGESIVESEGRTSMKAEPVKAAGKYESLLNRETYIPRKSPGAELWTSIFGKSEKEIQFESAIEALNTPQRHTRGKLGQSQAIVTNPDTDVFAATFIMGGRTQMSAILDTATDLVAVQGSECTNCSGVTYDMSASIARSDGLLTSEVVEAEYGISSLSGKWAQDSLCITFQKCVDLFQFFYITEEPSFSSYVDAVIGLARPQQMLLNQKVELSDRPFFLEALELNVNSFSTRMQKDFISWFDFGEADSTQPTGTVTTMPVYDDYFWSMGTEAIRFGESDANIYVFQKDENAVFQDDGLYTIFDTGASDIYISALYYVGFINQLMALAGEEFRILEGVAYVNCQANYPNLYFMVGGSWIQIPPEDYVYDASAGQVGAICKLNIQPIDAPFNIMGMPAFLGYYVTHSWSTDGGVSTMSFAPHRDSNKPSISSSPLPEDIVLPVAYLQKNVENGEQIAFWGSIIATLLIELVWIYLVYDVISKDPSYTAAQAWSLGAVGFAFIAFCFFLIQWLALLVLMPGNIVQPVTPADESVVQVNAGHVTLFGLVSYALYKIFGKKQVVEGAETQATVTSSEESANVNSLE